MNDLVGLVPKIKVYAEICYPIFCNIYTGRLFSIVIYPTIILLKKNSLRTYIALST